MTEYKPRVGDKIRLTVEGRVKSVGEDGFHLDTDGGEGWRVYGNRDYGVDLLGVPAYRVGTVAVSRLEPDNPAVRELDGWTWSHLRDVDVRENPHFTVVYEPPAR